MAERMHGGAPLLHIPLNAPAFSGLNSQAAAAILGPEWATRLDNTVLDQFSRLSGRKGMTKRNTSTLTGDVKFLFEHYDATADAYHLLAVVDTSSTITIHKSTDYGQTWSDVSGTATLSDGDMLLVELGGDVIGLQNGETPIIYSGTSFSDVSATNMPDYNVGCAAFGRIWSKRSATTVAYTGLLDPTDWNATGSGEIDLTSVWQNGDVVTAVSEFNGQLVIFGRTHVVIYDDDTGSELGLDPANAVLVDIISNVGCIARDSIQVVNGDLWFLSDSGVQRLSRLIETTNNPLINISNNVQDELQARVQNADEMEIKSVYSPRERLYLLAISDGGTTESGTTYAFDTQGALQDGSFRITGTWTYLVPRAAVYGNDQNLYFSVKEKAGFVYRYEGYDDDGESYVVNYESGWNDLGSPNLKILKHITGLLYVQSQTAVTFKWAWDFRNNFRTSNTVYPANASAAEWGVAEWGIAEWGGGLVIQEKRVPAGGTGEYLKVGLSTQVNGELFTLQQLSLYTKLGRLR